MVSIPSSVAFAAANDSSQRCTKERNFSLKNYGNERHKKSRAKSYTEGAKETAMNVACWMLRCFQCKALVIQTNKESKNSSSPQSLKHIHRVQIVSFFFTRTEPQSAMSWNCCCSFCYFAVLFKFRLLLLVRSYFLTKKCWFRLISRAKSN